ncbi:hypothetical protein [Acinetobacter seifertii]|uniref:hypothetical protein n=1 Tax=Acinetobacter seifertii TaxID=1530123 RepID=UPI004041EC83
MINELKSIIKSLKKYTNEERCFWLLHNYPLNSEDYYLAFQLIPHFSWGKKERKILMNYYLHKLPFSSERPYLVFLKISPLSEFMKILEEIVTDKNNEDLTLLSYHLNRIFQYEIKKDVYNKHKVDIERLLNKLK